MTTTYFDNGEVEQYWLCEGTKPNGTKYLIYSYGYKFSNGHVFQCVELSLEQCRAARDKWAAERCTPPS